MIEAKTKVYGPLDLSNLFGGEAITILTLPYKKVRNATIIASVSDNTGAAIQLALQPDLTYCYTIVEMAFFGVIQGFPTLLKRQQLRSLWGPMGFSLSDDDVFDQFAIKARLFIGGKPGIPSDLVFSAPLLVTANIHIAGREGIGD